MTTALIYLEIRLRKALGGLRRRQDPGYGLGSVQDAEAFVRTMRAGATSVLRQYTAPQHVPAEEIEPLPLGVEGDGIGTRHPWTLPLEPGLLPRRDPSEVRSVPWSQIQQRLRRERALTEVTEEFNAIVSTSYPVEVSNVG